MNFYDSTQSLKTARQELLSSNPGISLRKQAQALSVSRPQLDAAVYFLEVMEGYIKDELLSVLSQSVVRNIAKAQARFGQDDDHKRYWQIMLSKLDEINPATVVKETIELATSIKNKDLATGNGSGKRLAIVASDDHPAATPLPPRCQESLPVAGSSPFKGIRGASGAELVIYTYFARALVLGKRPQYEGDRSITGLFLFSAKVGKLILGFEAGCPDAISKLVEIEDAITSFSKEIDTAVDFVKELHDERRDRITAIDSSKPVDQFSLSFSSPYAYIVADAIKRYDQTILQTLTLRHLGRMTSKAGDSLARRMAGRLRAILSLADNYTYSNRHVDHENVRLPTMIALDKLSVMR